MNETELQNGLTIFDWTVIGIVGLSGLLALFRGFVREVLSLGAWLAAAFITVHYYAPVSKWLAPHIASTAVRAGISTVGLFLTVLVLAAIVNSIIMRFLNAGGDIGILDSILGMLFGIMRGLFILALGYLMVSVVLKEEENFPDWLKNAKTRPVVEYSAGMLESLAPNYVREAKKISKETSKNAQELREMQNTIDNLENLKDSDKKLDKNSNKSSEEHGEIKREDLDRLLRQFEHDKKIDPSAAKKLQEKL